MTRTRRLLPLLLGLLAPAAVAPPAEAVVGGRLATPADNPSMAGIVTRGQKAADSLFCGGSVIAPTVVVTAAHCMRGERASRVDVVAGATLLTAPSLQRAQARRILIHPGYDAVRTTHDVALVFLATPLEVPAITLAGPGDEALAQPGAGLRLTGWGEQRYNDPDSMPLALRYAEIPVVAPAICARRFDVFRRSQQFCGRAARNRPDSCQGDSGGPLIGGPGDAPKLVGIVSYGADGCARASDAGVYVRVAAERDWIATSAGLGGPAPVLTTPSPDVRRTVTTTFGRISCGVSSCSVVVRVTGDGRPDVDAVVLRVQRPEQRGYPATTRYAEARKVAPGVYRARTDLPYGIVRLTAVAFDAGGAQLGPAAREQIEVS